MDEPHQQAGIWRRTKQLWRCYRSSLSQHSLLPSVSSRRHVNAKPCSPQAIRCRPDDGSQGPRARQLPSHDGPPTSNPTGMHHCCTKTLTTERAQDWRPRASRMRSRAAMCASCRSRRRWWSWNRHENGPQLGGPKLVVLVVLCMHGSNVFVCTQTRILSCVNTTATNRSSRPETFKVEPQMLDSLLCG
ncbi:hypothetical protein FA95DRAFT_1270018 [Auriscalpium vulgare]|uniref:Uncharacterized protein n=1 Tax=Auriscalpium vulgare TaxID=40419 RepID=A0ACB8R2Q2_9AGAM|nr:hypothetical protein FA95DRAFT_1270018 [Auriscalpium vulgare]